MYLCHLLDLPRAAWLGAARCREEGAAKRSNVRAPHDVTRLHLQPLEPLANHLQNDTVNNYKTMFDI
jgi:hypothetical protein